MYITDVQNYTFSNPYVKRDALVRVLKEIKSNSKFDPCVTLQES